MRTRHIATIPLLVVGTASLLLSFTARAATQTISQSFVPLIGVTAVPNPLTLPEGGGEVTYRYAVKSFLKEAPLSNVSVLDDHCSPVLQTGGDLNGNGKLDIDETWRYSCTTKLVSTTKSVVTASGFSGSLHAVQNAHATVVVGSTDVPPLIGIINITKVAYPLFLPVQGGDITFTYRVNNPGLVPLNNVKVIDDHCSAMSGKLGDTNGNDLLDLSEVWIYHCKAHLDKTTTNTVSVSAFAGNMRAAGSAEITVTVEKLPAPPPSTSFWAMLIDASGSILAITAFSGAALLVLLIYFYTKSGVKRRRFILRVFLLLIFSGGAIGSAYNLLYRQPTKSGEAVADNLFGWKFPITKFPITGPSDASYSAIRDPGGIPSGLPVRLKIPIIGVDSVIEDALITKDGRMDVPVGSVDVAWFALGPQPGALGSAVIGGHFGIRNGVKFVFYDLDKLKEGNKVFIEDDMGKVLEFVVRAVELFDRNGDATTVFSSDDGIAHLNLITCEGVWNQVNGGYPKRRVVFTDALLSKNVAVTTGRTDLLSENSSVLNNISFDRNLQFGTQGIDVAALQTVLEQKKLLIIQPGVAKGYFGTLTLTGLRQYQRSIGLSPTGIFDSTTRAKLISEIAMIRSPAFPIAGTTGIDSSFPSTFPANTGAFVDSWRSFLLFLFGIFPFTIVSATVFLLISVAGIILVLVNWWGATERVPQEPGQTTQ